jgi:ABC-type nitrate/sulfonate/bicarbonate transport system permease component
VKGFVHSVGAVAAKYYSLLVLLAAWEIISRSGLVSKRLVPTLGQIAEQLWRFVASGDMAYHASITLQRAFIGFALAIVFGIAIGALMARSKWFERAFEPIFTFGYPIPKISLYPIFIFIFGFGDMSKIVLVFLECLYPIAIQTFYGMRSTDRVHVWAAQNMGASERDVFWRVLVPSAAPAVFSGIRIALPIAFIVTIITEIIGESRGLGFVVSFQSASFEYARAMAAFLVVGIIGFAFNEALAVLRRRVIFWQKDAPPLT